MREATTADHVDLEGTGSRKGAIGLVLRNGLGTYPQGSGKAACAAKVVDDVLDRVHAPNLSMLQSDVKYAGANIAYDIGMDTPGDRLRRLRKQRSMTIEEVSDIIGITVSAISQIETGVTKGAKPENFLKLCAFYDVDPYQIALGISKTEVASQLRLRRATRKT